MSLPSYQSYKDSGVEWLGHVPGHWQLIKLGRITEKVGSGKTPSGGSETYLDKGVIFLRSQNVYDDGLRLDQVVHISKEVDEEMSNSRAQPKDILLNITGASIGRSCLIPSSFPAANVNQHVCIIRLREGQSVNYVSCTLISPETKMQIASCLTGAARDGLNFEQISNLIVPLPPLPEQRAIASFLDRETAKIDALVEQQQRLIELLKEKRQAVISHAVTKGVTEGVPMKDSGVEWLGEVPEHWEVTKLGRFISILSGYAFPSSGFSEEIGHAKLLKGINIGIGEIKWNDTSYWKREPNDGLERFELEPGQIVIGMDRTWVNGGTRVARIAETDLPCLLLQRVTALNVAPEMIEDFVYALLSSEIFVGYFTPDMTGVSVPHLSPEQIASFTIAVPPFAEQRVIASHIQVEIERVSELMQESELVVSLLKERRSALISAAVTGKIDVRGLTTEEPEAA